MTDQWFEPAKVALIGVPSSAGARLTGQEQAPEHLRQAGLVRGLTSRGMTVIDLGDLTKVSFSPDVNNPKQQNLSKVLRVLGEVTDAVEAAVTHRALPVVIGGDCSITIGVLSALIKYFPDLGMAYLDGDVDLNTPETTLSGIFDGMVIAHIFGRGADALRNFGGRCPLLDEQHIALFGYSVQAGGLDPAEIDLLKVSQMARYPLEEVVDDIAESARNALRTLERNAKHILVHFDVDVVDYDDFPAVDVPHRPGLSLAQAQVALGVFAASPKTVGLVITEFNASQDRNGALARRLAATIEDALAARVE